MVLGTFTEGRGPDGNADQRHVECHLRPGRGRKRWQTDHVYRAGRRLPCRYDHGDGHERAERGPRFFNGAHRRQTALRFLRVSQNRTTALARH